MIEYFGDNKSKKALKIAQDNLKKEQDKVK